MIPLIILLGYFALLFFLEKLEHELRWRYWLFRHPRAYKLLCRVVRLVTLIGRYGFFARPLFWYRDRLERRREEEDRKCREERKRGRAQREAEKRERERQERLAQERAEAEALARSQVKQEQSPETALSEGMKDFL